MSGGDRHGSLSATLTRDAVAMIRAGALTRSLVGVGVDAVDVDRFRRVLARRPHLTHRLFTEAERAYALRASDPVPRFSTRFAAKEATMKALGVGLGAFPFGAVEVVRLDLDAPALVLRGAALARSAGAGVVRWHLSLTHTDQVAMAMVIAEGGPGTGRPEPDNPAGGAARP